MYSNPQRSSIRFVHTRTKSIPHVPTYQRPKISRLNQHSNALYLSFSENKHSRAKNTTKSSLDVTRKSTDHFKRITKPSLPDNKGLTVADPANGKFAIFATKAHLAANNLSKALETISSFMKTNRPFPDGQQLKGHILMQMGYFAEAEKEFEELIGSS